MKIIFLSCLSLLTFLAKPNNALAINGVNTIAQEQSGMYSPIFDSTNNIRYKKAFNASIGIGYQLNDYNSNISNGAEFSFINAHNVALVSDFTLNFTSKFWAKVNLEGIFMGKNSASGTVKGVNDVGGTSGEIKAVIGYDVFSFENLDVSAYGGLYYRGIENVATPQGGSTLSEVINYIGGVYGVGLTHYTEKFVTNMFFEGYLTKVQGYDSIGLQGQNTLNFSSSTPGAGFGIGLSTEIAIAQNLWIKPFGKFQMMFANNVSYDALNNGVGYANFMAATFGLALSWR